MCHYIMWYTAGLTIDQVCVNSLPALYELFQLPKLRLSINLHMYNI